MIMRCVIVFLSTVILGISLFESRSHSDGKDSKCGTNRFQGIDAVDGSAAGLPSGTEIALASGSKGWRQSGILAMSVSEAENWLERHMRANGFFMSRSLGGKDGVGHSLSEWENMHGEKQMWFLWPSNDKTGFSWGDVK